MSPHFFHRRTLAPLSLALATAVFSLAASAPNPPPKKDEEAIELSPFMVSNGSFGATAGGAKDIRFFRSHANRGTVPLPTAITAEGLFSEHDLPLELPGSRDGLFRVQAGATAAQFEVLPDVRYLAQLGLSSGLKMEKWKPAPLNLVAVVDKSGSMDGHPLAMVRASLKSALRNMRDGDQISIVLYGDRSHVHLPTTVVNRANRREILRQIDAIASMGSTNMEAGLELGYRVARESKATFTGNTRVMLFTDEQPNVGRTNAGSFMAMAEEASRDGIGLTTIGVGQHFGAELATRISSVRGGNLFFFDEPDDMRDTFAEEWDTLVTELAHEFSVRIEPAAGLRVAGVFGVPGSNLRWDGRTLVLDIATIFLSTRKGAIYFALAPEQTADDLPAASPRRGEVLANVAFQYREAGTGERVTGRAPCQFLTRRDVQDGLRRGIALVDQYLTLKRAAQCFHSENSPAAAYRLATGLYKRLSSGYDPELDNERDLVRTFRDTLAEYRDAERDEAYHEDHSTVRRERASPEEDISGLPAGGSRRSVQD